MRIGRIISIAAVSLAGLIVVAASAIAFFVFAPSRSGNQQNFAPSETQHIISHDGATVLVSKSSGDSSFLYRSDLATGKLVRLTAAADGIESEPSFSHDGKLVAYSYASSPDSKSSIWIVGVNSTAPHQLTGENEDALHPVFPPDGTQVLYAASRFTGRHSPVVRPARHDWDVFARPLHPAARTADAPPAQLTHSSFYEMHSLDTAADDVGGEGAKILISTSGYPIGALLREFKLGATGKEGIFQPHVPNEPSGGPAFGEARFINGGMNIVFLAATNLPGENYNYNVYSMSEVTGGELKQLTHLEGLTTDLQLLPDGRISVVNGGSSQVIDVNTQSVRR